MSIENPSLDLTNFPNSIDVRYIMEDPSQGDFVLINEYLALVQAGKVAEANQFLKDNPSIERKNYTAKHFNRHEQMIIALEEFFDQEVWDYLGTIVELRGAYSDDVEYEKFNIVEYYNPTLEQIGWYMCAKHDVPAGTPPTDDTVWIAVVKQGEKGDKGEPGGNLVPRGMWNLAVEYQANNLVGFNNVMWYALQNNTGVPPGSDDTVWEYFIKFSQGVFFSATQPTTLVANDIWIETLEVV